MYYVYVLRSIKNGRRYVGFSSKLPIQRMKEHNMGANRFTKYNRPFKLLYFEEYSCKSFALKREKFLKSGHGRDFLNRVIDL